jgi:DnaJ family protein C protein 16
LTEELEPVGFGIITIHAGRERELARKIGSNELPHMGLLFDGRIVHYKDPQFSALRSLEFVRSKLPYKLVEAIDDSNIDQFLNGWHDNRIRVLLFGKTAVIRLRYLATAFKFRKRAKLGYVQVTDYKTSTTLKKFNVVKSADTMLVFHEDPKVPVASVVMQDLALKTLFEVKIFKYTFFP